MATNLVRLCVYQVNQKVGVGGTTAAFFAFPTQGLIITDCITSPTRSLSSGYNVYSMLQGPTLDKYYVTESVATIVSLFNA